MKVPETVTQKVLMELGTGSCNGDLGDFCAVHSGERGTHVWFTEVEVEREEVFERPATMELIIEFLDYQERTEYWTLRKKFPDYNNSDWNWFTYMKRWLREAQGNNED